MKLLSTMRSNSRRSFGRSKSPRARGFKIKKAGGKRNLFELIPKPNFEENFLPRIKTRTVLVSVIGFVIISQVVLTIQTSTYGATLSELEKAGEGVKVNIRDLNNRLIKSSSLTEVKNNSESLGFYAPEKTLYLSKGEVVAKAP